MSSFRREDYEKVYRYAVIVYNGDGAQNRILTQLQRLSAEVMDMCEGVIGQQDGRPERSRQQTKPL